MNPRSIAKKAVAVFLKQPENEIFCEQLSGGSDENTIIKCTHLTTSYIVKIFSSHDTGNNEIAWTKLAADLGIGPKLLYANPSGNYMLIEFAKGDSLVPATANMPAIIKNIAANLKVLHNSSAPFAHESDMFTRIESKYKKLQCSGALKDTIKSGLQRTQHIKMQLQKLTVPVMPCHNDLNWGNIFVHDNRATFIDWGDAALGNPYYDIAAFFVLNVIEPKSEKLFFEQDDPELLSTEWQTYIQLCKQLVHFEFSLNLLLGVQAGKNELLHAQDTPLINHVSYYLTLLAEREVKIESDFLYHMALASLNEMRLNL